MELTGQGKRMETRELMTRLRKRYCPPEYALFTEVGTGTGGNCHGWADAVAMNLYPSRGLVIHGFELKVSRGDWLKELKNPAKAESIFRYCDYWWIVAAADVVKDDLPPTWGLIEPKGDGLAIRVKAPELQPQPLARPFIAALLRRATEQSADTAAVREAEQKGFERGKHESTYQADQRQRELNDLREKLREFETGSGIRIDRWTHGAGKIGAMVKFLMENDPAERLEALASHARTVADGAAKALAEFPRVKPAESAA